MTNTLYYGDNLEILRAHIPDESVDLIYLDPPFNSKANYNILFKEASGESSEAQITAFEDTWHWTEESEITFQDIINNAPPEVVNMMSSFRQFIGNNDMMAYLTMMCARLIELHRVLKSTGSLYLHCDPTASHYLKIVLDTIFDKVNYKNEIIWKRTSGHSDAKKYGNVHDSILFYTKNTDYKWNDVYQPYNQGYIEQYYRYSDPDGRIFMSGDLGASGLAGGGYEYEWKGIVRIWRCPVKTMQALDKEGKIYYTKNGIPRLKRYLDEAKGLPAQDIWSDIEALRSWHKEKLGYPTQKPESLLERILEASSDEGDVVLDPFCGCGTAMSVAQKMNRRWIGIDVTHLSINLMKWRMKHMFDLEPKHDYKVVGEPEDLAGAEELAVNDRFQFQWWATSLIDARPYGGKKKGKDTGIDGYVFFNESNDKVGKGIVSVKSGKVSVRDIRDLGHVIEREQAELGIFVTLKKPTRDMIKEAVAKGFHHSELFNRDFPKIQIITIEEILEGKKPDIISQVTSVKKAQRVDTSKTERLF